MLSTALATKLFAAPLLIGLASLAGKRWGVAVSGLLGGLPLVAGPVVLALWLERGPEIAQRVALTAPVGVWATMSYLLAFGFFSARWAWPLTLAASWMVYLAVATALHASGLDTRAGMAWAVLPALLLAGRRLLPHPASEARPTALPSQELLARMAAAVALVVALTTAATHLGPEFTGVLAGAPVAATVIPCFTLALAGRDAVLRVLRGFLAGQMGFAVFFLVLAPTMAAMGQWAWLPALLAGVATSALGTRLLRQ